MWSGPNCELYRHVDCTWKLWNLSLLWFVYEKIWLKLMYLNQGFKNIMQFAHEDVGLSVTYTVRSWKNATCLQGHFSLNKILRNHLISKNMQWNYMHHSMFPLIISCTRSCNFVWCALWCSTTESKNIVKPLAISQIITTCDNCFTKGKFLII